jgi:hypothetical protein
VDRLAAKLAATNVAEMAVGLASDPEVRAISAEYPDRASYIALVEDPHRTEHVRFAAALVLKSRSEKANPQATAQVFAAALQNKLTGYAYPWGRLWADGDSLGSLGAVLVEIGQPAVAPLTTLLSDTTPLDSYLGSEEATDMAMRHYRVKDFAASIWRESSTRSSRGSRIWRSATAISNLRAKL